MAWLYDIYLCLRPKNWSVMLSEEKLESFFTGVRFEGHVLFKGRLPEQGQITYSDGAT